LRSHALAEVSVAHCSRKKHRFTDSVPDAAKGRNLRPKNHLMPVADKDQIAAPRHFIQSK